MMGSSWPILLWLLGLTLIVVEVFVPSGGIIGLVAASSLLGSLVFAFAQSSSLGLIMLFVELISVPIAFGFAFRFLPRTRLGRRILLRPPEQSEGGSGVVDETSRWVGHVGRTSSTLRPTGFVLIDGIRLEARSQQGWIDSARLIRVVAVRLGDLIVVEEDGHADSIG